MRTKKSLNLTAEPVIEVLGRYGSVTLRPLVHGPKFRAWEQLLRLKSAEIKKLSLEEALTLARRLGHDMALFGRASLWICAITIRSAPLLSDSASPDFMRESPDMRRAVIDMLLSARRGARFDLVSL